MSTIVTPSEFVKKYAPWSISKADSAKQCPHKFWNSYVVKEKRKAPVKFVTEKGRAVHKALEFALSGRPIVASIKFALQEYQFTTSEIEEVYLMQTAIENFVRKFNYYCDIHKAKEILVEKKLAVTFEGTKTRYWGDDCFMRGMADVVMLFKNKPYAVIVDHKTGKRRETKYYANQFATYRMMLKAHYPHLEKIMIGVNWVQDDDIELESDFTPVPTIEPLVSNIISMCNDSTLDAHKFKTMNRSGLCGWCDFRYLCTAYPESDADGYQNQKEKGPNPGTV